MARSATLLRAPVPAPVGREATPEGGPLGAAKGKCPPQCGGPFDGLHPGILRWLYPGWTVRTIPLARRGERLRSIIHVTASMEDSTRQEGFSVQRIENDLRHTGTDESRFIVITDPGRVGKMRKTTRKVQRINYIPSRFGPYSYRREIERMIEDPLPKDSRESYFIQSADLITYLVYLHTHFQKGVGTTRADTRWSGQGQSRGLAGSTEAVSEPRGRRHRPIWDLLPSKVKRGGPSRPPLHHLRCIRTFSGSSQFYLLQSAAVKDTILRYSEPLMPLGPAHPASRERGTATDARTCTLTVTRARPSFGGMTTSGSEGARVKDVRFDDDTMSVDLADGRTITVGNVSAPAGPPRIPRPVLLSHGSVISYRR
jgi:hypothetical protein